MLFYTLVTLDFSMVTESLDSRSRSRHHRVTTSAASSRCDTMRRTRSDSESWGRLIMTVAHRWPVPAFVCILAAALAGTSAGQIPPAPRQPPPSRRDSADKDYGAELARFPMKSPAEAHERDRPAARVPRRAGRRRAAVAQPGGHRLRRGRPALRRRVPRVQPVGRRERTRGRTERAASGCWRTPTATASTTRAPLFAADVPMATAVACWDGGVYVGLRARPALPQGYRRRRQGRRAPGRLHRLRHRPRRRGDAELVPLGPRQPLPRLDRHRRRRRSAAAIGRRRSGLGPRP